MEPIKFKEMNAILAENQPEYLPLPVFRSMGGEVISCWKFTIMERIVVLFTGKIWWRQLTFNSKLQLQLPEVRCPFRTYGKGKNHFAIGEPIEGSGL